MARRRRIVDTTSEWKHRRETFADHGVILPLSVEVNHYGIIKRAWIRFAMFMDRLTQVGRYFNLD